jgi:hypothetical protein
MKRTYVALALGILAGVFSPPANAFAQAAKTARGTVTAIAPDSVTVKVADQDMKFTVDGKTTVEAHGATAKTRAAQKAGQTGPTLADVIKVGQPVEVSYQDMNGTLRASRIRAVSSVGSGATGGAATGTAATSGTAAAAKSSSGTVQSVSPTSMTINGSSGAGAKFTQTFAIDPNTKVIGKGAGTAAAAKGGRVVATDVVGNGDRVTVSFHPVGDTLHASEIRVIIKAGAAK